MLSTVCNIFGMLQKSWCVHGSLASSIFSWFGMARGLKLTHTAKWFFSCLLTGESEASLLKRLNLVEEAIHTELQNEQENPSTGLSCCSNWFLVVLVSSLGVQYQILELADALRASPLIHHKISLQMMILIPFKVLLPVMSCIAKVLQWLLHLKKTLVIRLLLHILLLNENIIEFLFFWLLAGKWFHLPTQW